MPTERYGDTKHYYSEDSVSHVEGGVKIPMAFLNSLNSPDLPPHDLALKVNCPIILLRNLRVQDGLCNGTRLLVRELADHVIIAEILTGNYSC